MILATKINFVNVGDYDQFVYAMKFDTKEPGNYARAMQTPNTIEWAKAIEETLD